MTRFLTDTLHGKNGRAPLSGSTQGTTATAKRRIAVSLLACVLGLAPGMTPPAAWAQERIGRPDDVKRDAGGTPLATFPFIKAVPISVILDDFKDQTGIAIQVRGKAATISTPLVGENLTPEAFLNKLSEPNKLIWRKTKTGYELWDEETFKKDVLPTLTEQKVFRPEHISSTDLFEAIKQSNILTPQVGVLAEDKRNNQVIVTDMPEKLSLVQDLIELLDTEQIVRVFQIKYADIAEVAKKLEEFKSEPGIIDVDELAGVIIVHDIQANISRMESLIELLDVRQPRKIYNLTSIGVEAKGGDALEANLKEIITEGAYYYIDDERGLLILEDRPEVHEEVEEFLKVFDRPVEQVMIQAELLDVAMDANLSYGSEFAYIGDLEAVVADAASGAASGFGFVTQKGSIGSGGLDLTHIGAHFRAQLNALLTDSNTRVLMRPRLIIKNREKADIQARVDNPIANLNYNNVYQSRGMISQSTVPSGLTISLEPSISPTGLIEIRVDVSNSVATQVPVKTGDKDNPEIIGYRKASDDVRTVLIVPDGETRVISGLIRHESVEAVTGVPYLVQIPWIGPLLFGSKTKGERMRNLLFFITPTIVRERASGSLVAWEFGKEKAPEGWLDSDVLARAKPEPPADVAALLPEPSPLEAADETATATLPAPEAPDEATTPSLFADAATTPALSRDAGATTPTAHRFAAPEPKEAKSAAPAAAPDADTSNTLEGLKKFLTQGQGTLPESLQEKEAPTTNFIPPRGIPTNEPQKIAPRKPRTPGEGEGPKAPPTVTRRPPPAQPTPTPVTPPTKARPRTPPRSQPVDATFAPTLERPAELLPETQY
jgi:type II secretory pathway component GspD/PulD (secretin)